MTAIDTRHKIRGSSAEQDRAAGGRLARVVLLDNGTRARASVEIKQFKGRAWWAYLRWSEDGVTHNKYVGRVHKNTRFARLTEGWVLARKKGLLADR